MLVWKAYSRMIDALAFSPDGQTLAVGGYYLGCRLINAATGTPRWTVPSSAAFGLSLAFTSDDAVMCRQGSVSQRSAADGHELRNYGGWSQSFAPDPDGIIVFVADGGHSDILRRYDFTSGARTGEVELESGAINRIAVSPDGALVAALGCKRFYLLDADLTEVVVTAADRALSSGAFALAFSPDGRMLVTTAGRTLLVWDVPSARAVARVQLDAKHFMDVAFTPDGRKLITVSKEGAARVWDTANWTCERSFAWDVGPLRAVAVAPDGTRAAVAGDAGRVVVWDLEV